jgi:putative transposase
VSVAEVSRRYGVSEQTIYRWNKKYGGLETSELRRLKALEAENARLKRLVAEQALDNQMLKEVLSKTGNACGTPGRCEPSADIVQCFRAACLQAGRESPLDAALPGKTRVRTIPSSAAAFGTWRGSDPALGIDRLTCPFTMGRLASEPQARASGVSRGRFMVRRRTRKRIAERRGPFPTIALVPNDCWSLDFMSDALATGR